MHRKAFHYIKISFGWVVVVHAFNLSILRQRQTDLCEFKVNLVYTVNSIQGRLQSYTEKPCLEKLIIIIFD